MEILTTHTIAWNHLSNWRKSMKKIRVLVGIIGMDQHELGAVTVSRMLRDAGMEVIYIGNSMPDQIIKAAVQEDADIIGVSSLGVAHLTLGADLMREAEKEGIKESNSYVIGGVISPDDIGKLKEIGFDSVFTSGATREEIINVIKSLV